MKFLEGENETPIVLFSDEDACLKIYSKFQLFKIDFFDFLFFEDQRYSWEEGSFTLILI